MAKSKTLFSCQSCGTSYPKWTGKCENCGSWNTLVEQIVDSGGSSAVSKASISGTKLKASTFSEIANEAKYSRIGTGIDDLDAVLGGGILPGGVTLIAGQPGMGKSTLLLQIAGSVSAGSNKVLYVSGEESASQVKMRADRLGVKNTDLLKFAGSTNANDIAETIRSTDYDLVIVDSIQTLQLNEISSAPGTVSQITNSANVIMQSAKRTKCAVVFVGHVTKEGSIAGPKVLEHLVDVVLHFEGDRYGGFKIVRAVKNRFGTTSESVIFDMEEDGLQVVSNPSAVLLAERKEGDGSIVFATIEGTRALLVEIQALVNPTSFGYPKRTASGFDINRLNVLIAVLEKRTKLKLSDKDVYVNVVGGIKLSDPAADLAVCMAVASAATSTALGEGAVVFGEVGLGGEVRSVVSVDKRLTEAKKLGFRYAIGPNQKTKSNILKGVEDMRSALIQHLKG